MGHLFRANCYSLAVWKWLIAGWTETGITSFVCRHFQSLRRTRQLRNISILPFLAEFSHVHRPDRHSPAATKLNTPTCRIRSFIQPNSLSRRRTAQLSSWSNFLVSRVFIVMSSSSHRSGIWSTSLVRATLLVSTAICFSADQLISHFVIRKWGDLVFDSLSAWVYALIDAKPRPSRCHAHPTSFGLRDFGTGFMPCRNSIGPNNGPHRSQRLSYRG